MDTQAEERKSYFPFNSNTIKILGALFMLIDHIGMMLLPNLIIFRIIGRIAMPIYAYMIAEGCKYTKNKWMYLAQLFSLGALCQIVFYISSHSLNLGILITYSFSVCLIFALQYLKKVLFSDKHPGLKVFGVVTYALLILFMYVLTLSVKIEYGFFGCMLAVLASIPDFSCVELNENQKKILKYIDNKYVKIALFATGLVLLSVFDPFNTLEAGNIQFYSLISVVFLLLYSEKKGKKKMKYFFYIFYPAHQAILELISWII